MNNEEIYKKIGEIANSCDGTMTLRELSEELNLDHSRGMASRVAAAYRYHYDNDDEDTAENIANTFVDDNGDYAYNNY